MPISASGSFRDVESAGVVGAPFYDQIAQGTLHHIAPWAKIGYNPDIGTSEEDLWAVGGSYTFPAAPQQMEVYSASASDTAAGTGIQQVIIYYLDTANAEKTEIVTLNGGVVATTATNILRVNGFRAYRVGTGKKAAGNIDLRHLSDTPIYSRIPTGYTRARNSAYRIPAGKTLYVTSITFSSAGTTAGKYARFSTRATYDAGQQRSIDFFSLYTEVLVQDGAFNKLLEIPTRLPQGTDILVSAIAGAASTLCSCALRGYLVED
jgi:hypothetical protein